MPHTISPSAVHLLDRASISPQLAFAASSQTPQTPVVAAVSSLAQGFQSLPALARHHSASYLDCLALASLRASCKAQCADVDEDSLYGVAQARRCINQLLQLDPNDPEQLACLNTLGHFALNEPSDLHRLIPPARILSWLQSKNEALLDLGVSCLHAVHCKADPRIEVFLLNELASICKAHPSQPAAHGSMFSISQIENALGRLPAGSALFDYVLDHLENLINWGLREERLLLAMRPEVIHSVDRFARLCSHLEWPGLQGNHTETIGKSLDQYFKAQLPSQGQPGAANHQCREHNLQQVLDLIGVSPYPTSGCSLLLGVLCDSTPNADKVVVLVAEVLSANPEEIPSHAGQNQLEVMKAQAWRGISRMYGRSLLNLQQHWSAFTQTAIEQAQLNLHPSHVQAIHTGLHVLCELAQLQRPEALLFAAEKLQVADLLRIEQWASGVIGPHHQSAKLLKVQAMEVLEAAAPCSSPVVLELVNLMNEPMLSTHLRAHAYAVLNGLRASSEHARQGLEHFEASLTCAGAEGVLAGRCWEKVRQASTAVLEDTVFEFIAHWVHRLEVPIPQRLSGLNQLIELPRHRAAVLQVLDGMQMAVDQHPELRMRAAYLSSVMHEKSLNERQTGEGYRSAPKWLIDRIAALEGDGSAAGPAVANTLKAFWVGRYNNWDGQIEQALDAADHSPDLEWAVFAIQNMATLPEAIFSKLSLLAKNPNRCSESRTSAMSALFEHDPIGRGMGPLYESILKEKRPNLLTSMLNYLDIAVNELLAGQSKADS